MPSSLQEQIAKVQKKLAELKAKSAAAKTKERKPQRGTQGFAEKPSKPTKRKAQNVRTTKAPLGMTKTKKTVDKQAGIKSGQPEWKTAGKLPPGLQGRELPPGLKDKGGPPGLLKPAKPVKVQKEREEEEEYGQRSKRAFGPAKRK